MNIKPLLLLAILFTAFHAKANYSDTLVLFEKNQVVYLLADSVNIRKEPNAESALVAKLPIGSKLTILSKSTTASKINNIIMPWYLVEFNGKEKGYVWGGKIAMTSFRSNKNPEIVFHFGMEKTEDGTSSFQIRVERSGKELQRLSFKGFSGYLKRHTCTNLSNKGLSNVDDIIQVDGYGESCGDDGGSIVFFWSNNKLTFIDKLYDVGDGGLFTRNYFVYPSDMEGQRDVIIKREEEGESVIDETKTADWYNGHVRYDKKKFTNYKWDGKKLVKVN